MPPSLDYGRSDMGSSLWLVESTLDLPDLPGRTQLSLMIPINHRCDPIPHISHLLDYLALRGDNQRMKTPIGRILLALLVLPVAGCGMSDKEMKATIHKACADGDLATVRKLLEEDPSLMDFKEKNRGRTPLFSTGSREVAEFLVDKGADVNQQDRFRWTPLHTAADEDIAEFLISNGADPTSAAMKDLTPLHTAVSGEVAQVLPRPSSYTQGMKTPIGSILLALLVLPVAGCGMSEKEMKAAIHKVCADGDLATVRKLLDEDPSLKDFKEDTTLRV